MDEGDSSSSFDDTDNDGNMPSDQESDDSGGYFARPLQNTASASTHEKNVLDPETFTAHSRGRKHVREVAKRKREVAKRLLNTGKSYIGNRGIVKPARQLLSFNQSCRYKCNVKLFQNKKDKPFSLNIGALVAGICKLHFSRTCQAAEEVDTERASTRMYTIAIVFDLQKKKKKTLPIPRLSTNKVYYLHQLWTYNCGIHNLVTSKVNMFMWDESTAKRGSQEVGSCLVKYINSLGDEIKHFIAYTDCYTGQNLNVNIVKFWMYIAEGTNTETVHHKFLEPGHTFNECDQDFWLMENRKRNEMHVYVPDHWVDVVRRASKRFQPIKIKEAKWKNLQELKMCIPPIYHVFFDQLVYEPVPSETRTRRAHGKKSGRRENETNVDDTLTRAHIQEITAEEESDLNGGEAESADEVFLSDEVSDILDIDNE
ncbi:hypothetical protein PR048_019776 [Dryococelus australis]|uniref:Uncharacterized protein n=1 Tax=Dryococelus australis TaxID=614101 RepID=A0ABQ9H4F5_9NEOP|nr:hypothetical protein PR048_019776 [Dryococelus australis]